MAKPINILLIMTDQQRFDTLGCMGNETIQTPNLDHIASEGTVFKCAYTPSPSCIPARASLMTGMNNWNTGILGMGMGQGPMGAGFEHTLPGELAKAGYHTYGVGKMHFAPQRSLMGFHNTVLDESSREEDLDFKSDYRQWFERVSGGSFDFVDHGIPFNSWDARPYHAPEYMHPSNWTVNEGIKFLKERDITKPFFLKVSFARPHSPYDAPEWYFNNYMNKNLPEAAIGDWAEMHDNKKDAADINAWRGKRTDDEIRRARAGYYGSVHHIDHQIGRLFNHMRRNGIMNDTMIIFTSDHGDMLGDQNLWRKTYAYEGSAHIPMLVRMPKSMRENIIDESDKPVSLYDIMPTVLDAAGVDIPNTVDGKSMLPLTKGIDEGWREFVHGEHCTCYSTEQEMQFLTDGKIKYVWLPRLHKQQLFDLENDPYELNDLSENPEYSEIFSKWQNEMIKIMTERDCGAVSDGELVSQDGKPPFVSPNYKKRMDNCGVDWDNIPCRHKDMFKR